MTALRTPTENDGALTLQDRGGSIATAAGTALPHDLLATTSASRTAAIRPGMADHRPGLRPTRRPCRRPRSPELQHRDSDHSVKNCAMSDPRVDLKRPLILGRTRGETIRRRVFGYRLPACEAIRHTENSLVMHFLNNSLEGSPHPRRTHAREGSIRSGAWSLAFELI